MVARRRLSAWYFFYFAYIGAFSPYFTLYLQSLRFPAWDIGVLMSLSQAMRLVAPALWGWLADRLGRRVAIVRLAALLAVAGFLVFFITVDFRGVFLGMIAMTFFWSAALPLVEALTLAHLRGRTEGYGRIRLWGSVGYIAAVLGVGVLLDMAGLGMLLWVCLGLLLGILACSGGLADIEVATGGKPLLSLRHGLKRPAVTAFLAACFFMSAAHGPLYVFFSIHLVNHGYGNTVVGMLWSLGVVAEILVFLVMPHLMRRFSLRAVLMASFGLAVLRFLLIGWKVEVLPLLLLAQVLHGATFGAFHAAAVTALNRWFPAEQQGRVQAIYGSISFGAGGMAGNLVAGRSWGTLGAEWTFTLGAAFAVIGWLLVWRGMASPPPEAHSDGLPGH